MERLPRRLSLKTDGDDCEWFQVSSSLVEMRYLKEVLKFY
jgi:hypothetical protein